MPRLSAVAVLRRMMDELARHDWPTEQTWADACRVTGRPVPPPIVPTNAQPVNALLAVASIAANKERP